MKHTRTCLILGVVVACMLPVAAAAHHSFSAEFDINKPATLTGMVTEVRWSNPHGWIYIDVKGEDGKVVNWAFELAAANQLYRRGWRKEDLQAGTLVTVEGWLARNGTPTANAGKIMLSNGKQLYAGAAEAAAPVSQPPQRDQR